MEVRLSPLKAIRRNCIECHGGAVYEVKGCHITDCALYPFRFGKRPAPNMEVMTPVERERHELAKVMRVERGKTLYAAKMAKRNEQGAGA